MFVDFSEKIQNFVNEMDIVDKSDKYDEYQLIAVEMLKYLISTPQMHKGLSLQLPLYHIL